MSYSKAHKERLSLLLIFALLLVLAMLVAVAWDEHAGGFSLPSMDEEHEDLKEWVETVRASDYQNSRNPKDPPARKASQDVHAMYADNMMDMEMSVPPSFDINSPTWWDFDAPDWWDNPAGEYGTRPAEFPWDSDPSGGGAWRVCRPESGGYYVDCGQTKQWDINQPSTDIIWLSAFAGPGIFLTINNDYIKFQAMAGADDGQQIHIAYNQIPVIGGKKYPEISCEKTYHVQCEEECPCVGDEPDIMASAATVARGASVNLWIGTGFACGPFSWTVTGTGFHFVGIAGATTGETEEELEIIELWADATACGPATITVTDSCGVSSTSYILCTTGTWATSASAACGNWSSITKYYYYSPICRQRYLGDPLLRNWCPNPTNSQGDATCTCTAFDWQSYWSVGAGWLRGYTCQKYTC